jgi:hypothetical protein
MRKKLKTMKKIITFMFALCVGMVFASAQIDSVVINGNGTYTQYVDTVLTPVNSTMYLDTIGIVYDTVVSVDTIGGGSDTSVVVNTTYVVDTNYTDYDTAIYNMIAAIPDSGWAFSSWIVTFYDTTEYIDTFYVNAICIDWTDSLVSIVLNFDSSTITGITNIAKNYDMKVYPNPTTGYITIDVDNYKNCTVYAMNGSVAALTTSKRVDMTNMPVGMYIIRVTLTDNTVLTHKIVRK